MTEAKILRLPGEHFNGIKLQIARENADLSRAELASLTEASPSFITACEKGRKKPSAELEALIAHKLKVRPSFFHGPTHGPWGASDCHFRHRQNATERIKGQFRSQAYLFAELIRALNRVVKFPSCSLPTLKLEAETPVEAIARNLRIQWGIGIQTPIARICRLVENSGVVVGFHSLESPLIDACSKRSDLPVILVTKSGRGTSRLHYDIAHELAELIFSESAGSSAIHERLVNGFVGALFMPEVGFAPHFRSKPLTISHLWEMKRTWRVSGSAILQRALKLQLLTYETFVLWKRKLIARGFGRIEPEEPTFGEPESVRRALAVAGQEGVSVEDLADAIGVDFAVLKTLIAPYLVACGPIGIEESGGIAC